jgi:hypothetical protein
VPCAFDRGNKLALMVRARAGDPARDNFPLFRYEALETFLIFIIDINIF